jgi:hypothetical protein
MGNPHDGLFKGVLGDPVHAAAALRAALPAAIAARIDWSSLSRVEGSFVDARFAATESDLLFEARAGSARVLLYLLFEHQSTVDRRMPVRLLEYMVRIWSQVETPWLPPIVPVVLHHSRRGWHAATSMSELYELGELAGTGVEQLVPRFRFVLEDLSEQTDQDLASRSLGALVHLVYASLRDARTASDPRTLIHGLAALLREVLVAEDVRAAYLLVLRYLVEVTSSDDPRAFLEAIEGEVGVEAKEQAMGLLDAVEARGEARGMRNALLRQMQLKFGAVPPETSQVIVAMSSEQLSAALDRIVTASSAAEVLG